MRNLLIFITKYSAFFLFIIFEALALYIFINYNNFQHATFVNTANDVTGDLYKRVNNVSDYLALKDINNNLSDENARLRNLLKSSFYLDSTEHKTVVDSVYKQQYTYIGARVINNTINRPMNYLTINKGSKDGVAKGMGVIADKGVVGIVVQASEHFALVRSLLHRDTRISAMIASSHEGGSFRWSDDRDPHKGLLYDVANSAQPHLGDSVITDEHSLFPTGILLGRISNLKAKASGFFLNMEVNLSVDFGRLEYVYVINNNLAKEQLELEASKKTDE